MTSKVQEARLDAIAVTRCMFNGDDAGAATVLDNSPDLRELAHAACGLAGSLLFMLPEHVREHVLLMLLDAAHGPDGVA